ncbi:MAG: alternative ribosome rescue aminoacyl-tRNA hydrolase ArfB [Acidobacteriota bacterium]
MLQISDSVSIPEEELKFSASPSSGPGGQHVNRASTRVTIRFDVSGSPSLSEDQKQLISQRLSSRINQEGVLQVASQTHRSQSANKKEVTGRLSELLSKALQPRKKRKPTRVSPGAKERRLKEKSRRGEIKRRRSKASAPEE